MEQNEFDDALRAQVAEEPVEPEAQPEPVEPEIVVPADYREHKYEEPQAQYQYEEPQYVPMPSREELEDAMFESPQDVAVWAIENEDGALYDEAMAEWYEQDPRQASRFEGALEREVLRQEIQQEPAIVKAREQEALKVVTDAYNTLSQKYPDFQETVRTATDAELAGIDRGLLAHLQQTNPQAALELAYRWASSARASSTRKRQASVVTSGAYVPSDPELSVMEKLKASMLHEDSVQGWLRNRT